MRIENIRIKNYRLFRCAELLDLPEFTIVVGANGSGKSALFDVFTFLKDALTHDVRAAVARRGGFRELVSRGRRGPIGITVQFRESGGRLATYILEIAISDGQVVVSWEILRYRHGPHGGPSHFVDFRHGEGQAVTSESVYGRKGVQQEREEFKLVDPSVLAIKGLGQFRRFRVVSEFRNMIENWHVSDFHISDARPSVEAGYAEHLSATGDNLAQVTQYLHQRHPECFGRVLDAMRARVPEVSRVEARPTEDGRLVLRFQDEAFRDPFIARYVSGGTIKMFGYLILLYDPKPHPLLAVEGPENHLYPDLLLELVDEFRDYARRGGQVFVSTHSPVFLNCAGLEEVFWLAKEDGFASVRRTSTDDLLNGLADQGDKLGTLWRQGLFKGAGPQ